MMTDGSVGSSDIHANHSKNGTMLDSRFGSFSKDSKTFKNNFYLISKVETEHIVEISEFFCHSQFR